MPPAHSRSYGRHDRHINKSYPGQASYWPPEHDVNAKMVVDVALHLRHSQSHAQFKSTEHPKAIPLGAQLLLGGSFEKSMAQWRTTTKPRIEKLLAHVLPQIWTYDVSLGAASDRRKPQQVLEIEANSALHTRLPRLAYITVVCPHRRHWNTNHNQKANTYSDAALENDYQYISIMSAVAERSQHIAMDASSTVAIDPVDYAR